MDQQLLEDTIHELACRDRYMLASAEACMHVRDVFTDLPEREVIDAMWGEHAPPDLEAMLVLAMVERSVRHHLEAGTVLQGRELPSVMAAACKALEGAMNIEATALGVAGLLEDLSICRRLLTGSWSGHSMRLS